MSLSHKYAFLLKTLASAWCLPGEACTFPCVFQVVALARGGEDKAYTRGGWGQEQEPTRKGVSLVTSVVTTPLPG